MVLALVLFLSTAWCDVNAGKFDISKQDVLPQVKVRLGAANVTTFNSRPKGGGDMAYVPSHYDTSYSKLAFTLPLGKGLWFFATSALPVVFSPAERDVELQYRISFATLQHPKNSVKNAAPGKASRLAIRLSIVDADAADSATTSKELEKKMHCSYSKFLRRSATFGEEACVAVRFPSTFVKLPINKMSDSSSEWSPVSHTFKVLNHCTKCSLVVRINNADGWTSHWGSQVYVAALTVERLPIAIPKRVYTKGTYERVAIRPFPRADPDATLHTGCPHESSGLRAWNVSSTWPDSFVPVPYRNSTVTIPPHTQVLYIYIYIYIVLYLCHI